MYRTGKSNQFEMYVIYANAWLTIAATSSQNSEGSCYSTASPHYVAQRILPENVYVRKSLRHVTLSARGRRDPEPFRLLNRAWVCQERRLSKRMLHFTSNELVWECREGMACECRSHASEIGSHYKSRAKESAAYESVEPFRM